MKPILNYIPRSMSFSEGFRGPKGDLGYLMVVSHKKIRSILTKVMETKKIKSARYGLDGDWTENSELVCRNNKFLKRPKYFKCYQKSIWAKPILIINFYDSPSETYEVWTKKTK